MTLSARQVVTAKRPGLYGDGGGLYLKVNDNGARSWIYRWTSGGKVRKLGLGPIRTMTLLEARERANDVRRAIRAGTDPRVAKAKSITFDEAADAYAASHKAGWRNAKHAAQWATTLRTYASPVFGKLPVSAIDTGMVMRVLGPIWATKNATVFRVRGRIEVVLGWAKVHGYRSGENPAQWRGNLDHLLPAPGKVHGAVHHAAMPYAALPGFMGELRAREGIAARALEFTILTAARTGEVLGARWSEIDLENKMWIIPAARMKSGREHRVPLSDRAIAITDIGLNVHSVLVFPGARPGRPLATMTFSLLLDRMGRDVTTHGFRSSFRDWVAEQTNFPSEVAEMALAHTVGDKVVAAYRRSDLFEKRRHLMDAWSNYCSSRDVSDKVIELALIKN